MSISTWAIAGEAGILRGITTGMIPGIVIVLGGLTHPGMAPVGDSAGDGAVSMPAGVVPGTVVITVPAIGAVVTGVEATGEVAITDTITIIIIQAIIPLTIMAALLPGATEAMLIQAEGQPADTAPGAIVLHPH